MAMGGVPLAGSFTWAPPAPSFSGTGVGIAGKGRSFTAFHTGELEEITIATRKVKGTVNAKWWPGPWGGASQQRDPPGVLGGLGRVSEGGCCRAQEADETEPVTLPLLVLFLSGPLFSPD